MLLEKISLLSGASISTSLAMPAGKSQHGEGSPLTLPRTANDTTKIGMRFRRSISRNVPKRNSRIPTIRTSLRRNVSAWKRRFRKEERVGISIRPSPCVYSSVRNLASSSGSATRHGCSLSSSARPASVSEIKIHTGVCPLRPIFVSRIPCPPPTGSPSTYSNRSAGASPQSRPTRVPHAVRGSRATPLRSSTGDIPARNTVRTRRSRAILRVCGRAYSSDYFNRYSSIAF